MLLLLLPEFYHLSLFLGVSSVSILTVIMLIIHTKIVSCGAKATVTSRASLDLTPVSSFKIVIWLPFIHNDVINDQEKNKIFANKPRGFVLRLKK